jgi:malate synthase
MSDGMEIKGELGPRFDEILTSDALELLGDLHRTFDGRRLALLQAREDRYAELARGGTMDFLPETARSATATGRSRLLPPDWRIAGSRSRGRPTAR